MLYIHPDCQSLSGRIQTAVRTSCEGIMPSMIVWPGRTQNRFSVRILLGFNDPLRPLHTILLDLDMKLAGRVAISSRITSNHQGGMYFLHVSKQHMGYKVRPLNLLWSPGVVISICSIGISTNVGHRTYYIFAIIAFNEYPWNISEIIAWGLWHRMVSAFPAAWWPWILGMIFWNVEPHMNVQPLLLHRRNIVHRRKSLDWR